MKNVKAIFVVLALAFTFRLAWAVSIPVVPLSDSAAYDKFASVLAEYGVYGWTPDQPSAYWPVGTSAIYAALYLVFGHSYTPIVVLNVVLGTAIVGMTVWLGRCLFDANVAFVGGCLMAIWPSEIAYVTILGSELPFTFLVLLGFVAWYSRRLNTTACGASTGLAFGAASYVRPIALLLPIVLWLTALPNWRKWRAQLPMALLALAVTGATIVPWSIRNTKVFGEFVLLSTNGGSNMWMGNNPDSDGSYMSLPTITANVNESKLDRALGEQAKRYIFSHPIAFVLRSIKKAVLLHVGETIAVHWNTEGIKRRFGESALFPLKLITQGFWTGALLLALSGLVIMMRANGIVSTMMHPVVVTWGYFTAIFAVTAIQDRYHFPSHPFIAMLAAIAIVGVARLAHGQSLWLTTKDIGAQR